MIVVLNVLYMGPSRPDPAGQNAPPSAPGSSCRYKSLFDSFASVNQYARRGSMSMLRPIGYMASDFTPKYCTRVCTYSM